jgi:hypothetical protein
MWLCFTSLEHPNFILLLVIVLCSFTEMTTVYDIAVSVLLRYALPMRHKDLIAAIISIAIVVMLPSVLLSQTHQHQASRVSVLVDGKLHPEDISDNAAIIMLFITSSVPPDAPPIAVARCNANIAQIGLKPEDEARLRKALMSFQEIRSQAAPQIEAAFSGVKAGSSSEAARHRDLKQQVQMAAIDQFSGAIANMTPEGQVAMRKHLQSMKRNIRIIPQPPM